MAKLTLGTVVVLALAVIGAVAVLSWIFQWLK